MVSKEAMDVTVIPEGDIPQSALEEAKRTSLIAWDIETSGLDWKQDHIATCQILIPRSRVFVVRINGVQCKNLESLLQDASIQKVFHHAMFDLRFLYSRWSVSAKNVVCTKIASKILNPEQKDHSLKHILQQNLGIALQKGLATSNWLVQDLTSEQVNYAALDVLYLPELFQSLREKLINCGRWSVAERCFDFLPTQVQLDVLGAKDVFGY